MSIAAILIADECGSDGAPIALYRWDDDRSLVEYEIEQILDAGVRDIEVVLGADADGIIALVARENVEPIVNPSPGQGTAIRVGASAVPRGTTTAIVARVSEPRPSSVYSRLLAVHADGVSQITRPSFEGSPGEPIVVGVSSLQTMRNLHGPDGLRPLLAAEPAVNLVPWLNDLVIARVDSEAACAAIHERYGL